MTTSRPGGEDLPPLPSREDFDKRKRIGAGQAGRPFLPDERSAHSRFEGGPPGPYSELSLISRTSTFQRGPSRWSRSSSTRATTSRRITRPSWIFSARPSWNVHLSDLIVAFGKTWPGWARCGGPGGRVLPEGCHLLALQQESRRLRLQPPFQDLGAFVYRSAALTSSAFAAVGSFAVRCTAAAPTTVVDVYDVILPSSPPKSRFGPLHRGSKAGGRMHWFPVMSRVTAPRLPRLRSRHDRRGLSPSWRSWRRRGRQARTRRRTERRHAGWH